MQVQNGILDLVFGHLVTNKLIDNYFFKMFALLVFAAIAIGIDIDLINMIIPISMRDLGGSNAQGWGIAEPSPKINFLWIVSFPECEAEGVGDVKS